MSRTQKSPQTALVLRAKRFYALLSAREFEQCFQFIDPRVRIKPGSVTLLQYRNSLAAFVDHLGAVQVQQFTVTGMHLDTPSKLYEGRDFAIATTDWKDAAGNPHQFAERWVAEDGVWYTRATGFTLPMTPPVTLPSVPLAEPKTRPTRGKVKSPGVTSSPLSRTKNPRAIGKIQPLTGGRKPTKPNAAKKPTRT